MVCGNASFCLLYGVHDLCGFFFLALKALSQLQASINHEIPLPPGGGSFPLEAVPHPRERESGKKSKKLNGKGTFLQGWARNVRYAKIVKIGKPSLRVLAV